METTGLLQKQLKGQFWAFREIRGARGALYLPYSSRMTFNTRRTMLPTVVSDGWAAVILWPSVRIRSMSSPKRGEGFAYRCPEQAHVSIKPVHPPQHPRASSCSSTKTTAPRNNREGRAESLSQSSRFHWCLLQLDTLGHNTESAAHLVFPLKEETTCCWKGPCSD